MLYLNQQDYPDIPYPNNISDPASTGATSGNIAKAGCGLCSMAMVVDHLTMSSLSLEDAVRLSVEVKANEKPGTDMKRFGQAAAERFGLVMSVSDDPEDMIRCLEEGGRAIINVGGDHDDHIGTFSDVGHYVTAIGYQNEEFCILDPAYRTTKYTTEVPDRVDKVREEGIFLYTTAKVLMEDTENRSPRFYLFRRASDLKRKEV